MRGDEAGEERDQGQRDGGGGKDHWVASLHVEEDALRRPGDPERGEQAEHRADHGHDPDLAEDHQPDAAGGGTERHSQADLARPLSDGIGQHTVEADRGQ